ncbi:unnamed protein product [Caenorhabditis angaria]|uniref:Carboxypeptidase n=1 Tax=Caenorhabditis angaria TaxID=860376 RepID=A0A9P1J453_9PELO|nr:unnamed protein product [Caenorhabditis angaria]
MQFLILSFFLLPFQFISAAPQNEELTSLPNLTEPFRSKHYNGYLPISDQKQLFYWFVESENDPSNDPLILWLNGGPGCASMEGLFIEMGPFRVRNYGEKVDRNPWTWNRIANIIYLDAPAGVGYSYYNSNNLTYTDDQVASDNFDALALWFKRFPEFAINSFYIAGESYAGTYVPMLSAKITNSTSFPNFKGMLIGNGCLDDKINFNADIMYQYYHGLIDETQFQGVLNSCCGSSIDCNFYKYTADQYQNTTCGQSIENMSYAKYYAGYDPYFLYFACYLNPDLPYPPHEEIQRLQTQRLMMKKFNQNMRTPSIDIAGQPDCASHDDHIPYLNTLEVRAALRIPDYVPAYAMCNYKIGEVYVSQYTTMTDFFNTVINAKKRVTLFNGDADTLCNVVQNAQFLKLNLNRTLIFGATSYHDPVQLPTSIGLWTKYDGVELVTIKGGGHFPAATEQKPKETFQMFQNFVRNQNYSTPVEFDKKYIPASSSISFSFFALIAPFFFLI